MKRAAILVFSLIWLPGAHAITHLYLNNMSSHTVTSVPAKIVLTCDTASSGNSLVCEIFVDMNGNNYVDTHDERIHYLNLVDGLGWIYDGDLTDTGIPGDETGVDGFIRTTLHFDEYLRPYSPQNWLVRVTDANNTSVIAQLKWDLDISSPKASGIVRDKQTGERLPNVLVRFRDAHFPDIERLAITDSCGSYAIQLAAGDWQVLSTPTVNKEYSQSQHTVVHIREEQSLDLDILVEKYASFVQGVVHFDNKAAVENITIALQNTQTLQIHHIRTDETGQFNIGLEPGEYILTADHYSSRYLGNHYWPDGFYARPAVDTVIVDYGDTFRQDITFLPYPITVHGRCESGGQPLADVLVQGFALDPDTNEKKFYQTFSKADGTYSLGIDALESISVVAQKEGFTPTPLIGMTIDVKNSHSIKECDFQFRAQSGIMSLGGSVFGDNKQPLPNVYIVAYNMWEHTPKGHLITQSDSNGHYYFDIAVEGDWQVGIFKPDAEVHPEMYYQYMSPGLKYDNLDFIVSNEKTTNTVSGDLKMASFSVLPHQPNPFYKETVIDFVLPTSSHTQVEVLDMAGNELTTLLDHELSSGFQKVRWDGTDAHGNVIANGVYLCRVTSKEATALLPITLLR